MTISQSKAKRYFVISLICIAGCLLLITLIYLYHIKDNNTLPTATLKRSTLIQRVTIAGLVGPNRRTFITAPYRGYIKKIYVKIGDYVAEDAPLISITQSLQSNEPVFPLRAPFAGKIVRLEKGEGEYVRDYDAKDFLLRIDDLSKLFVFANAPEIDRTKLKIDQEVTIRATALLNKTYKGVIRELAFAANERDGWAMNQVIEFPVRIEILDSNDDLLSGMSVLVDVITEKKENVLALRYEFIQQDAGQYFVVLKNGEKRKVELGLRNEEEAEITFGLKEGDVIRQVDFQELVKKD